jgi:hypothetical protein
VPPFSKNIATDIRTSQIDGSLEQSHRCISCKRSKSASCFYPHSKTKNGYEGRCKECKKKTRGVKQIPTPITTRSVRQKKRPKETIEPKINETSKRINEINFSDLEQAKGGPLEYVEKYDAVQRLNEFVSILKEEYAKVIGYDVYVRKD